MYSRFETIKVCTSYLYKGKEITHLPYSIEPKNVTPKFTEFKGWKEDLTMMTQEDQLPRNLLDYIKFIEKETQTPIKLYLSDQTEKQTIIRQF